MSAQPTTIEKIQGLRWSYGAITFNTVFVQFTFFGSAFVLFLNELNLNKSQIGLLLSFFPFFGLVALFIAPRVARFGYKRTYITFFGIRKLVAVLLLLVPFIQREYGGQVTLVFVALIVMGFGLCRAIAEVGYYPWNQEFVPANLRGRYSATANLFGNITGIAAVGLASIIIDELTGLGRFTILFAIGSVAGLISVALASRIPGGASTKGTEAESASQRDMLKTFQDRNFWLFILCLGLVIVGTVPMFSFLPLFMEQEVGLSEGNAVLLTTGVQIGALSATVLVGWAADRYGSKPVMLSGLAVIILLPVAWILMPKYSSASFPIALGISVFRGIAVLAWTIGFGRLLFVNVVPPEEKTSYMAVYYASIGVIGGTSQLLGGFITDLTANVRGTIGFIEVNPFTPIHVLGMVLCSSSFILFRFVRADSSVGVGAFAGMFVRGNPIMAFESMIRYYRARDERAAVAITERLGVSHSPLTVDELLLALNDPRFNVRFEAIISIARATPDPRYVEALAEILSGTELSLTVVAAWALGRIGDEKAVAALQNGLNSEYRSIRAHCARALGTLGDTSIAPLLLDRLETEPDKGLQMAYASALGSLKSKDAADPLLGLLAGFENPGARMEIALSLGRIVGEDKEFVRLLRQYRNDPGTSMAQALTRMKRGMGSEESTPIFDESIALLANNKLDEGVQAFAKLIDYLPPDHLGITSVHILDDCMRHLAAEGAAHPEYLILALHMLDMPDTTLEETASHHQLESDQ